MDEIRSKFENRAEFLTVYIKEAHPEDEWQMTVNEKQGVCYTQPKTLADRVVIANDFIERFQYTMPLVVDPMENPAEDAFAAWPERLYVIGVDGRIAYRGGKGPFGFDPDELEQWLEANLPAETGAEKLPDAASAPMD
jgi:type I thyroxine 5'-deiodinase